MPGDIAISGVRILLIDDDPEFCSLLNDYLELNSISLTCAHDGQSGLDILDRRAFDLILLDMFLPDINGLDVLRRIRRMQSPPVVMLSAHNEETDRIIALEIGADDYVPKAFSSRELLARIRAVLRRTGSAAPREYRAGPLRVCPAQRIVQVDDADITLTNKEFELLCLLLENQGIVLARATLMDRVWGMELERENRTLDVHVRTLRAKLGPASGLIETVRGVGYRIGGERT